MPRLAVIGLGGRMAGDLNEIFALDPEMEIAAIADPDPAVAGRTKMPSGGARHFPSVEALVAAGGRYDGVLVGTQCNLHTHAACALAPLGAPLFLEKPVAITDDEVVRLAAAWRGREDQVVVSFPLRYTPLFRAVLAVVRSGALGAINQIQAFNNVNYGGVYFGQWYRDFDRAGGLWLQKATHDFDYINLLAGSAPTAVAATVTKRIYGGDKPHDLICSRCDETLTCPESPRNQAARGDNGGMGAGDHGCAFSREIKNEDAGSALIMYADGVHAAYSQNFVSRRTAGQRGARVTGYLGTVEFDWYTDSYRVIHHHDQRVDRVEVKASSGHGGGDQVLAQNFVDLVRGRARSHADLNAGLLSAAMCLAARTSAQNRTFQPIPAFATAVAPAIANRR
ncbi:MAG: Gfo/Idh/MocA family oxidoreductase [Planctomycetes bacterium]|nr:Gfo/Idh/MocA family oxidoreductase [Planctomycetota bacterium]